MVSLSGCVSASGNFCDAANPIYLDSLQGKTENEKRAILAHNIKGRELCGWTPAGAGT